MKTTGLIWAFMLSLLAAPLFAGEAEDANSKAFLEGLKGINEKALGEEKLHFVMFRSVLGEGVLNVSKGAFEGTECYVVKITFSFAFGAEKNEITNVAHIAPDLTLLHEEGTEKSNGEVDKSRTVTYKDGVYTVVMLEPKAKSEADRKVTVEVKKTWNLLMGAADLLSNRLLPTDAKTYAFVTFDGDSGETYPATVEAIKDLDSTRFVHTQTEAEKKDGEITTKVVTNTVWLKDSKFVRVVFDNGVSLETTPPAKLTPLTEEAAAKLDSEMAAVALFFYAQQSRNEDTMKKAVNISRFTDMVFEKDERLKNATPEEKEMYKPMVEATIAQNLMGPEQEDAKEKARNAAVVKLILQKENFIVSKDGETVWVTFHDELRGPFGDLKFQVEKTEKGEWQVVWIESGDDKADEEEDGEDGF